MFRVNKSIYSPKYIRFYVVFPLPSEGSNNYYRFPLTQDIYENRVGAQISILVLCVAAVRSPVFRADWVQGIRSPWFPGQRLVVPEPGVVSCWVGITAAAQSH